MIYWYFKRSMSMTSEWFPPGQLLCEYISAYVLSDYDIKDFSNSITCAYPSGSAVLCFSLDGAVHFKELGSKKIIRHSKFNFIHQLKRPRFYQVISFPDKILHVVFKPFGAYRILGIPQNCDFNEDGTALSDLFGAGIAALLNQIEDAGRDSNRVIQLVNEWLETQLIKNERNDVNRIHHACKLIDDHLGGFCIEKLTREVCLSKRALEYKFEEQVGLLPKLYGRIIRFNGLLDVVQNNKRVDWKELAFKYGYFDQAHLIKEFKHFSGSPPGHFQGIRSIVSGRPILLISK